MKALEEYLSEEHLRALIGARATHAFSPAGEAHRLFYEIRSIDHGIATGCSLPGCLKLLHESGLRKDEEGDR